MFVKTFYNIISGSTGIDMSRASDFKLLDRKVVDSFLALPERHVFFRALSSWVGYKTAYVEFDVQERELGESKWSFKSLVKYAINNITSFFSCSNAASNRMWNNILHLCSNIWCIFNSKIFPWIFFGRIYNRNTSNAYHWWNINVQPWNYRILYF